MKTKTSIKLFLIGLILVFLAVNISAQINFEDVSGEPVLTWGENTGDWDWGAVWFPSVIKDGDTLRMWFTGCEDQIWIANSWKIGYAWSLDGIEWNKYEGNPVLLPNLPWEGEYHGCTVIKDADTLKMWYGTSGPTDVIGYATSLDGISWTKHPSPVLYPGPELDWDDTSISTWTVIKEDGEYKMWYDGRMPGFPQMESLPQIGLATSPDGKEWTKYDDPTTTEPPFASSDPVFKVGETGEWDSHRSMNPMVLKKESGYEMWYAGLVSPINTNVLQQIGYATSDDDGIVWDRHPDNPVYTDPTPWGKGIYGGSVLKFDGYYHLWYACFSTLTILAYPQIGYAISDIDTKVKYQQNPQVQLIHNYPNPFTSSTTIKYELTVPGIVSIGIYNHFGEQIETIEKEQSHGKQQVVWNAEGLPAGIYFCVLKTSEGMQTIKLLKQ